VNVMFEFNLFTTAIFSASIASLNVMNTPLMYREECKGSE
jgi:hypothetical protein